jgi:DNA-directed RNA polymerase specialized sigma24 family protein
LREVYRHYLEFREYVAHPETPENDHVIDHTYLSEDEDGTITKHTISFSFWDLHRGIKELAPRKREALFFNVILDQKQADVAKRMGITTVSVGQYVDAACRQLVKYHFTEHFDE